MDFGKYGVYPGDNLQEQLEPFKSAMELEDGTSQPAGMMPYYSIMYDQDPSGENLGNAFSNYIITDLLKEELGFDGLVCTDWGVSVDGWSTGFLAGAPWGVEDITDCERIATAWEAGTHQIGIYNETEVTLDTLIGAYEVLIEDLGEEAANEIIQNAAEKTILNMMRIDLFDNPYVNPESAAEEVGNAEYMEAGYEAQVKISCYAQKQRKPYSADRSVGTKEDSLCKRNFRRSSQSILYRDRRSRQCRFCNCQNQYAIYRIQQWI